MKKVLLLEDDRFLIRIYKAKLLDLGYEITMLEDGDKGLETALKLKPDLIVTDIIMPKKNGFDVIKELKENKDTKNIPIIVLTNLSQDEDREKVIKLGADYFLVKANLSFKEVVAKIQEVLG